MAVFVYIGISHSASEAESISGDKGPRIEMRPHSNPNTSDETRARGSQRGEPLIKMEMDLIRKQLAQCWNPAVGARNPKNLIVEIEVDMNADRTVHKARVVDATRLSRDDEFRAAAENALRAIHSHHCNPLQLPPHKYETWKYLIIRFDPEDIL